MNWRSPILRVSLGIGLLTLTLLLTADAIFGLSTESLRPQLIARKHLAETLAVQYSELASRQDVAAMKTAMSLLVDRNAEVLSTAVRQADGSVLAEAGNHRRHWRGAPPIDSTQTHARVPIFDGPLRWGTLEIRFTDIAQSSIIGLVHTAWFKLLSFVGVFGSVAYFFYMRRSLRYLDPTAVIPARVKAAFDVLAEGVAFIDTDERIVLANRSFAALTGRSLEQLMGVSLSSMGWTDHVRGLDTGNLSPWAASMYSGEVQAGAAMILDDGKSGRREFMVNAAPVLDDGKQARGAIVTFDDVTELERKKQELERVVAELRQSRDHVRRQNEKLEMLATRDSLTNCLNRRCFVELLEREVTNARRDGTDLSCIMLDIDNFKSVNDTYGHVAGDEAIRFTAGVVNETVRGFDIVCRYGGEEFCVLLPTADLEVARVVSERIREAIMSRSATSLPELEDRTLTVSLGVSRLEEDMGEPMDLVDRADGALYVSKTSGRNRTSIAGETTLKTASVA